MNRCISKKDYTKKDNSNVGYALYVEDNIKKDDYARLNTGEIVKVIGIMENDLNKKAIYYDNVYGDWFDAIAVENFSEKIIDLIEIEDIVFKEDFNGYGFIHIYSKEMLEALKEDVKNEVKIKSILTHEQYGQNCFKIEQI